MVTDARYTDNVVLKREAYQELLTGIKHYPVIDIDYMEEWDTDDRTNRQIWSGYTEDSPCIKITYGDPQTTKGNVIFSTKFRKKISDLKKEIEQLQNALAKQEQKLDRLRKIYNDNNSVLVNETKYLQAYENEQINLADEDAEALKKILNDKTAGLIQMISAVAHAYPQTENQFENFSEQTIQEINFTETYFEIEGTSWSTVMLLDDPIDNKYYVPIRYDKIPAGTEYYYTYNSETKTLVQHTMPSNPEALPVYVFTPIERDEVEHKANEHFYLKLFHDFEAIRTQIAIPIYRMAYEKYTQSNIGPDHLPQPGTDEMIINQFYEMAVNFINLLEAYETNWGYYSHGLNGMPNPNDIGIGSYFESLSDTIYDYINQVFLQELRSKIDTAAEHYNMNYGDPEYQPIYTVSDGSSWPYSSSYVGLKERIQTAEDEITQYENWIDQIAAGTVVINENFNDNQPISEHNMPVNQADGTGVDRRMFGYKYVKVGSNIHFDHTYTKTDQFWCPGKGNTASILEKTGSAILSGNNYTAQNQKSGTFRVTINNHVYEVPIKGFTEVASNQDIYIKTQFNTSDGTGKNINFQGNLTGVGSIVTNNGHIYASTGAVGAATYLAMRGFPNFTSSNIAGFWYDGTKDLIRTWDIEGDDNSTGLGTHTLVLIQKAGTNGDKSYDTNPVGIQNNNGTLEVRNLPTNNDYAPIKAKKVLPPSNNTGDTPVYNGDIGDSKNYWNNLYVKNINVHPNNIGGPAGSSVAGETGYFKNLYINGKDLTSLSGGDTTAHFWRGDGTWSNDLRNSGNGGELLLSNSEYSKGSDTHTNRWSGCIYFGGNNIEASTKKSLGWIGHTLTTNDNSGIIIAAVKNANDSTETAQLSIYCRNGTYTSTGAYSTYKNQMEFNGAIKGDRVFNAVFNDYAEYRPTIDLEPGRVVIDNDDGSLSCSSQRLQPGGQIISDTFGTAMGETDKCQTPLAVAGRVLVYTYQPRENYHAGMAVCSAPNGTIDIMSREEIRDYPDCIIGIVSEIPNYEEWGTNKVKVNGRIWIKS